MNQDHRPQGPEIGPEQPTQQIQPAQQHQPTQQIPSAPQVAPELPQTAPYQGTAWAAPGPQSQHGQQGQQVGADQFAGVGAGGAGGAGWGGPGQGAPGQGGPGHGGPGQGGWNGGQWNAAPRPAGSRRGLRWAIAGGALALAVLVGGVPGFALGHSAGTSQAESQAQGQVQQGQQGTSPFGGSDGSSGSDGSGSDGSGSSGDAQGGQGYQNLPFNDFGDGSGSDGSSGGSGSSGSGSSGTQSSVQEGTKLDDGQDGMVIINTTISGGKGAGTGMILSSDGTVLTNYHVVEGSTEVKVTDSTTGKTYTGSVVGHDATHDVAVVKLENASGLKTVETNTDGIDQGQAVAAVGNASGEGYLRKLTGSVTATDQSITTEAEATSSGEKLDNLIETDADVVPGYSGGALVNEDGQVVGMTTAASSGTTSDTVDGYAIPISEALEIAQKIEDGDSSDTIQIGRGAALGISVLSSDSGQVGGGYGVTVNGLVDGGAAKDSGISAGDTIIELDGQAVKSYSALKEILAQHQPGDKVSLTWLDSSGKQQTKSITLGESTVN